MSATLDNGTAITTTTPHMKVTTPHMKDHRHDPSHEGISCGESPWHTGLPEGVCVDLTAYRPTTQLVCMQLVDAQLYTLHGCH